MKKAVSYAPGFAERRTSRGKRYSPHPQLTDQELAFLRNEIGASLGCGADDPLFGIVYRKLKLAEAVRALRSSNDGGGGEHGP